MTIDSTIRNAEIAESVGSIEASNNYDADGEVRFEVTGCAAHTRLSPLVPGHWINESPYNKERNTAATARPGTDGKNTGRQRRIEFLWENAPRSETKPYRDHAKCYSHLPNGTSILDDKWVLARLFASTHEDSNNPSLAVLESHCFRGFEGFQSCCRKLNLTTTNEGNIDLQESSFPDILDRSHTEMKDNKLRAAKPTNPPNMWVVKDAGSNGAGGIWVVSPENLAKYLSPDSTPLLEGHRYVAQKYAWPPVLYDGKKCHVRVYGLFTSDGRAFVHKRAFLHVANDPFQKGGNPSNDEVHITNCCANSHKKEKFAGEICADFERNDFGEINGTAIVPLKEFFPSVSASVSALAKRTMPYLKGGEANNGFEYLGMDFILSYAAEKPVAYLLEVNAPPSQDTATGLPHAEDLHDDVIRDIITLWVMPSVTGVDAKSGGWRCVHNNLDGEERDDSTKTILPSKAAILNKIRWAIFERKASKLDDDMEAGGEEMTFDSSSSSINGKSHDKLSLPQAEETITADSVASYARSQFPYFEKISSSSASPHTPSQIFFENAGGSQVPREVIVSTTRSLANRHRSVIGSKAKEVARNTLLSLIGGNSALHEVFLGPNATTLFELLSQQYVHCGFLKEGDEVVVCSENHLANVNPWINIAKEVGAKVKWWRTTKSLHRKAGCVGKNSGSNNLEELISERTRIVALSHASNILGQIRDIRQICHTVKERSHGCAHVIVDGVAAAPHIFPDVITMDVDWYAVSCHKLFGPHLGCLVGKKQSVTQLSSDNFNKEAFSKRIELGTINYEACAGIEGLGEYFRSLATYDSPPLASQAPFRQTRNQCTESFRDRQEDCHWGVSDTCQQATRIVNERHQNILAKCTVEEAYRRIRLAEKPLLDLLRKRLQVHNKIRLIESSSLPTVGKIPVVGFLHRDIHSRNIVDFCSDHGILCRSGTFLCTSLLLEEFLHDGQVSTILNSETSHPDEDETEIVRISLAHYNTRKEIEILMGTLEAIPGW